MALCEGFVRYVAELPEQGLDVLSECRVVDIRVYCYYVVVAGTVAESEVGVRAPASEVFWQCLRSGSPVFNARDLSVTVFQGRSLSNCGYLAPRRDRECSVRDDRQEPGGESALFRLPPFCRQGSVNLSAFCPLFSSLFFLGRPMRAPTGTVRASFGSHPASSLRR